MPLRRVRRLTVTVLAVVLVAAAWLAPVDGSAAGRSDLAQAGCGGAGCHGGVGPAPDAVVVLTGWPEAYVPGDTYLIEIGMTGVRDPLPVQLNLGGFALGVSDGALAPPPGATDVVVEEATGNATHTDVGATQRAWTVVWTAPPPTAGTVTLDVAVLAANGNGLPDALDEWAVASATALEAAVVDDAPQRVTPEPAPVPPQRKDGVPASPAVLVGVVVAVAALVLLVRRKRRSG